MKKLTMTMVAAVAAGLTAAADVVGMVDFREEVGVVRPELHSSGLTPRSSERAIQNDDEAIRSMGFMYARTHDWALVLDHTRDNFPVDVSWRNGRLTLVKPDKNSSAWFVTFE